MVPACKNQDMHKLAILEATTEYLAYLEEAIKVYKNAGQGGIMSSPPAFFATELGTMAEESMEFNDDMDEDNDPEDELMESSESSPILEPMTFQQSVLEITDTEATHALLLLADHQSQCAPQDRSMGYIQSKPISVKDLLQ